MDRVITEFIMDIVPDKNRAGKAESQTKNVNQSIESLSNKISKSDFQIMMNHSWSFLSVMLLWKPKQCHGVKVFIISG